MANVWAVAVRDQPAYDALNRFGPDVEMVVTPDTVFGLPSLLQDPAADAKFQQWRGSHELPEHYLVVQATRGLEPMLQVLRNTDSFRGYGLVLLPIGPVLGDSAQMLGESVPGMIEFHDWPPPRVLANIIRHAEGAIGNSMHFAITAMTCGVPVFRPADCRQGKYAVLDQYDGVHVFDSTQTSTPDWLQSRLGRRQPSEALRTARTRLDRHWDRIAAVFSTPTRSQANQRAVSAFWESLPQLLEARAARSKRAAHLGSVDDSRADDEPARAERGECDQRPLGPALAGSSARWRL